MYVCMYVCMSVCGKYQTVQHVLSNCSKSLVDKRYTWRHNSILSKLYNFILLHLCESWKKIVDLPDRDYIFPSALATTSLRPDIVLWCPNSKQMKMLELTVCFEENFSASSSLKKTKFKELVQQCQSSGWETSLLTLQVGSRSLVDNLSFNHLIKFIRADHHEVQQLFRDMCRLSIAKSFVIWCKRDSELWTYADLFD